MATGRETLLEKIREIARRSAAREGIEVWDVELLGSGRARLLRIYIDKPEGVTHGDCELISEQVSAVLDVENLMPGDSYQLEVSSPGVERRLRHGGDFERFRGQLAKVTLREAVENQRRWEGRIGAEADGTLTLEAAGGKAIRFRMEQVEKANLKFEW